LGLDEKTVGQTVEAVQNELRADRGPDFYKLPVLMEDLGIGQDQQVYILEELQNYLQRELVDSIKRIEGVPNDVKTIMVRALKGALDYIIH